MGISVYDFKKANKFSKDNIRGLSNIFEEYSRYLSNFLTTRLRMYVPVEMSHIEQMTFMDYSTLVNSNTLLSTFSSISLGGRFVVETEPQVYNAMLNVLLGGTNIKSDETYVPTELDLDVLKHIFEGMATTLSKPWAKYTDLKATLDQLELRPQFLQLADPHECVVFISLNISIAGVQGRVNFCMPHLILETVLKDVDRGLNYTVPKHLKESEPLHLVKHLGKAKVSLVVLAPLATLHISDFLQMRIGHSFFMGHINVSVENKRKYIGTLGQSAGCLALQIQQIFDGSETDMEYATRENHVSYPQFQELHSESGHTNRTNMEALSDIPLSITVQLGKTKQTVHEVMQLTTGSVLKLDTLAGDEVDILANGKHIGKGEVVVIDDTLGVRITSLNNTPRNS